MVMYKSIELKKYKYKVGNPPPIFPPLRTKSFFHSQHQRCLTSPCLGRTAASHSQGEGAPLLAGASLCPTQKKGERNQTSSDQADPAGAFPHYGIPHPQSPALAVGSQTAPPPAQPGPTWAVAEAAVGHDSCSHLEAQRHHLLRVVFRAPANV